MKIFCTTNEHKTYEIALGTGALMNLIKCIQALTGAPHNKILTEKQASTNDYSKTADII